MTCSMSTTVTPEARTLRTSSSTSSVSPGFRPPTGSSSISKPGSVAIAEAIINRFLSKRDNGPAIAPSLFWRPTTPRRPSPARPSPRRTSSLARRATDARSMHPRGCCPTRCAREHGGDLERPRVPRWRIAWGDRSWISWTSEDNPTGVRSGVAADRIEQRRLACAVRTGDAERLSSGHRNERSSTAARPPYRLDRPTTSSSVVPTATLAVPRSGTSTATRAAGTRPGRMGSGRPAPAPGSGSGTSDAASRGSDHSLRPDRGSPSARRACIGTCR